METLPVSVIIPTFNRAALVPRAVASALAAMRPGDEVIVVDDGSTDDTEAAVAAIGDDRVRFLQADHGGAGRARNLGVSEARHPLVAFLDSDDEWTPDKLEIHRMVMCERPDVVFSFTDFAVRHEGSPDWHNFLALWHGDERGWESILGPPVALSALGTPPEGREDVQVYVGDLYPEVLSGHFVPTFTLVVRRQAAGKALWFADDVPTYEDLECHARLAQVGPAAYIDCETAFQWGHGGARLTDADRYQCASARLTIVERVYGRDRAFMKSYRDRYERVVQDQHLERGRFLLVQGRAAEARRELRQAGRAPLRYRAMASLPSWVLGPAVRNGRRVLRRARSLRRS